MNVIKILVATVALFLSNAQAALVDTYNGSVQGFYLPYEGLLAGFFNGDLSGTPILQMSVDPTIHTPPLESTPVTLFSYSDVMAPTSGFTLEEQVKLSQIGALIDALTQSVFISDFVSPPTECFGGDTVCIGAGAWLNPIVWNIWVPGSVSMSGASNDTFTEYTSGAYNNRNWIYDILVMQIADGDTFVIPLGGANPETLAVHTPIPTSAWLLGSGLMGLVGVSRRRTC